MSSPKLSQAMLDALSGTFATASLTKLGEGTAATLPERLWSEVLRAPLQDFLGRPSKALRAELIQLSFDAVRPRTGLAVTVPTALLVAVEAFHAGSLVIDDIEDGSATRRGGPALHHVLGTPQAINSGNWLYFWPFELFDQLPLSESQRLFMIQSSVRALGECHYGQALDLAFALPDVDKATVAALTRSCSELKTGSLMGLGAALGAAAAGASSSVAVTLGDFGRAMGIGLQMLDDLSSVLRANKREKAEEDLRLGKVTWPFAWMARRLDETDWEELMRRLRAVRGGEPIDALLSLVRERLGPRPDAPIVEHFESASRAIEQKLGRDAHLEPLHRFAQTLIQGFLPSREGS